MAQERISRRCKYALRAILELAVRGKTGPIKIRNIASAQAIPPRFLEAILSELKHGGFVESRRGSDGGYLLARPAGKISVGQVLRFLRKGAFHNRETGKSGGSLFGDFAFLDMHKKVNKAVSDIYDHTTFADLVERELEIRNGYSPDYAI